jgi:hypothetical protein
VRFIGYSQRHFEGGELDHDRLGCLLPASQRPVH